METRNAMEKHSLKRKRPEGPPRIVVSLDLDCFYASVAIRARPHLKDEPVGIVQKHLVVTTNYVARRLGVKKMSWLKEAQRICPQIRLIDGSDLTPFRAASAEVLSVVRNWLAQRCALHENGKDLLIPCEKLGLDEVFVDLTHLVALEKKSGNHDWSFVGHVEGFAADDSLVRSFMVASHLIFELRSEVTAKTRLTQCAGISSNKLLAKLACDKKNGQTVLLQESSSSYLAGLPPRALMGIGHSIWGKLKDWSEKSGVSIGTVQQLLAYFENSDHVEELSEILGNDSLASQVLGWCHGKDNALVKNSGPPKVMSCEQSFLSCTRMEDITNKLESLVRALIARLREDFVEFGFRRPKTLTVKFRHKGGGYRSGARSAPMPFNAINPSVLKMENAEAVKEAESALVSAALTLLRVHAGVESGKAFNLSLLGIGASNFSETTVEGDKTMARFLRPVEAAPVNETSMEGSTETNINNAIETDSPKPKPLCPICECVLPLGTFFQNAHIDSCISTSGVPKPSKSTEEQGQPDDGSTATPFHSQRTKPIPKAESAKERPHCPICQCALPLGTFFQNAHIDSCISSKSPQPKADPSPKRRKKVKTSSRSIESFFRKK